MMECYQKCLEIGKRCKHLGSTGSCTDCGQLCRRNFFIAPTSSSDCKCTSKPLSSCCKDVTTTETNKCTEERSQKNQAPSQGTNHSDANRPGVSGGEEEEKQSFWEWLLSLVGLGKKKVKPAEEKWIPAKSEQDGDKKSSLKTQKPIEIFSPPAILAEVKEICDEIKKHNKPEPKTEQHTPPLSPGEEVKERPTSPSPKTKKKAKSKGKSSPKSKSPDRDKYFGKPLEASPKRRSRSHSPPSKKSPLRTERSPAVGDVPGEKKPLVFQENIKPPTSPIYSSTKYLREYASKLCPENPTCQECCNCSPTSTSTRWTDFSEEKSRHNREYSATSTSCAMPCGICSCSACCPAKPCVSTGCPKSCCCSSSSSPLKRAGKSGSSCSCRSELIKDMRKRTANPCGSVSPRCGKPKFSKRKRSSSCPSSPSCCSPRPCFPPCPPILCCPICRPVCKPTCKPLSSCSCCPPPRPCCPAPPLCRPCTTSCSALCKPCPPPCPTPSCYSKSVRPMASCSGPTCRTSGGCPITCMKPCCLPSTPSCSTRMSTRSSMSFSNSFCGVNSYSKSRDNDALCKQLMAKYNISAPDPRVFCPIPRNLCPPCDFSRPRGPSFLPAARPSACPKCGPISCLNNNKPLPSPSPYSIFCNPLQNYTLSKPSPYIKDTMGGLFEHFPYQKKTTSPNQTQQNKSKITYDFSPSHEQPRIAFRIPKRTPVECIKKKGPRSPCKEYMSINFFDKEKKKDKTDKETTSENGKTTEDSQKLKQKASKREKSESKGKSQENETAQNLSGNKPVSEVDSQSVVPSDFLSWRASKGKSFKKKSVGQPSEADKTKTDIIKANRSPNKTPADVSHYEKRYSPISKIYYPSTFSLSPVPNTKVKTSVTKPKTIRRWSSISPIKESYEITHNFNKTLSHRYMASSLFETNPTNPFNYYPSRRATLSDRPRSFDMTIEYPGKKWGLSPSPIKELPQLSPLISLSPEGDNGNQEKDNAVEELAEPKNISTKETDSSTILPKVESISSLIEKYDNVEVSSNGVMAQSKCNVFDYISAESCSANSSPTKKDPPQPIAKELTLEEYHSREHVIVPKEEDHTRTIETWEEHLDDKDTDTEADEMNKGLSKTDHAQGDNQGQRAGKEMAPSSCGNVDVVKISESIGDNLSIPLTNLNFESIVGHSDDDMFLNGESSVDPAEYGTIGESAVDPVGEESGREESNKAPTNMLSGKNNSNNKPCNNDEPKVDPVDQIDALANESAGDGEGAEHGESASGEEKSEVAAELAFSSDRVSGVVAENLMGAQLTEIDQSNEKERENVNCSKSKVDPQEVQTDATEKKEATQTIEGGDNVKSKSALEQLLNNSGVKWTRVNEATEADIKLLRLGKAAFANTANDPSQKVPKETDLSNKDSDTKPYLNMLKPGEIESSELYSSVDETTADASTNPLVTYGTPV